MKNCLIREYKYSVLITNLPTNMKKETIESLAQRVLRNNIEPSYMMSSCSYTVNPYIVYNDEDDKTYGDSKKKYPNEFIDFKVDYEDIKKDDSFSYILGE